MVCYCLYVLASVTSELVPSHRSLAFRTSSNQNTNGGYIVLAFGLTSRTRPRLGFCYPEGSVSFLQVPPTKILHTPLLSPIHATCLTHLILLDLITRTILGEQYRSLSSSLCSFLHSPVTLSLLGPNTLLNTLFSNTLSLRSSLNVREPSFTPTQKVGKIIVLYILNFKAQYIFATLLTYLITYSMEHSPS